MRLIKYSLLTSLIFAALSCSTAPTPEAEAPEFVPGDLFIGIKPEVNIESVFNLMNGHGLEIDKVSGFFNYSTLPPDSLAYVIEVLVDKPYLNKRGFTGGTAFVSPKTDQIIVAESMFEMNENAQKDWLNTIEKLRLTDIQIDHKNILIKVKPGTEVEWIDKLLAHPYVFWAEPNWLDSLVLH
ncbi:hypothetical protein [Roseivirga pacifica]|uniref:hypothetical protein n=1 Tax=Roseivirga pacifica TaxID=1267423 RepID=UPI00227B5C25|nr:hypothetical protein [Roseivirga pacifica]